MNSRTYFILFFLAIGCSEKESPEPSPFTGDELISLKFNDQYLVANSGVQVSYYKNVLDIYTDSIYSINGYMELYQFHLYGSASQGINNVTQNLHLDFTQRAPDGFLTQYTSVIGQVTFDEYDTDGGEISGSFNITVEDVNENTIFELSEGSFNNLKTINLFCEPEITYKSYDTLSIYGDWQLAGILTNTNELIYPPCGSNPTLSVVQQPNDNVRATGTVNGAFWTAIIDLENQTIVTGRTTATLAYDNPWGNDFEKLYFGGLSESSLEYYFTPNELVITNQQNDQMSFVPIE